MIKGKTQVSISAVYKDGTTLLKDRTVPARTYTQEIPGHREFQEVAIRMVIPARLAEELHEGLGCGTVTLEITGISSIAERNRS